MTETPGHENNQQEVASDTEILVAEAANGDVLLRFGEEDDGRRLVMLNEDDARDLYEKLNWTEAVRDE